MKIGIDGRARRTVRGRPQSECAPPDVRWKHMPTCSRYQRQTVYTAEPRPSKSALPPTSFGLLARRTPVAPQPPRRVVASPPYHEVERGSCDHGWRQIGRSALSRVTVRACPIARRGWFVAAGCLAAVGDQGLRQMAVPAALSAGASRTLVRHPHLQPVPHDHRYCSFVGPSSTRPLPRPRPPDLGRGASSASALVDGFRPGHSESRSPIARGEECRTTASLTSGRNNVPTLGRNLPDRRRPRESSSFVAPFRHVDRSPSPERTTFRAAWKSRPP